MEYRAIPFNASIATGGSSADAARQVQEVINKQAAEGWEFVNSDNIATTVQGTSGCFGLGAQPPAQTSVLVLFFKR
jgi:hypothetical protein